MLSFVIIGRLRKRSEYFISSNFSSLISILGFLFLGFSSLCFSSLGFSFLGGGVSSFDFSFFGFSSFGISFFGFSVYSHVWSGPSTQVFSGSHKTRVINRRLKNIINKKNQNFIYLI